MLDRLDTITYWPQWIAATLLGLALDEYRKFKLRAQARRTR